MRLQRLNLNGTVTRDQFVAAMESLGESAREMADNHEWCGEERRIFPSLSRYFNEEAEVVNLPPASEAPQARREWFTSDEAWQNYLASLADTTDYAAELRDVRGRILYYLARREELDGDEVNEAFINAGLPSADTARCESVYIELPMLYSSTREGEIRNAIEDLFRELNIINENGEAPSLDVWTSDSEWIYSVPADEITEPLSV